MVARVAIEVGVLFAEARTSHPPTLTAELPALNNSMNSSLSPLGPRNRYSLITMPDALRAHTCSCINVTATTTATVAAATNQVRALMTVLANCVGGRTI